MNAKGKIINDPVYGFIRFPEPEMMLLIEHPWFQRLRNIRQMGMATIVYPGATHSRFHHSLGAAHLMQKALDQLRLRGIQQTHEEYLAARMASLLHDIGHGPFSHALEHSLVDGIPHEQLSRVIMKQINVQTGGMLDNALQVFSHTYPKKYLHQLVSSQLDVDRMDYLNRDSFYTGVSEGVIGYDRILQMLTVRDNELVVEEKGVHSVEKFIIARRIMYWQVYLHKTVLGAEQLLVHILKRAKELALAGEKIFTTPALHYFLYQKISLTDFESDASHLEMFCLLDDADIQVSIKMWRNASDNVLSKLSEMFTDRKLFKTILSSQPLERQCQEKRSDYMKKTGFSEDEASYFVFSGTTSSSTYNTEDEKIRILMKNESILDISEMENALVNEALARPVHKNYFCYAQF